MVTGGEIGVAKSEKDGSHFDFKTRKRKQENKMEAGQGKSSSIVGVLASESGSKGLEPIPTKQGTTNKRTYTRTHTQLNTADNIDTTISLIRCLWFA